MPHKSRESIDSQQEAAREDQRESGSRIPVDFTEVDESIMSDIDGSIDYELAEQIKGKPLYTSYPAYNFIGYIWWRNDKWCCEFWRYNCPNGYIECDTLEDIRYYS